MLKSIKQNEFFLVIDDGGYSVPTKLDPSQFMLMRDGHASAPTLAEAGSDAGPASDDQYLVRSPEIEDIPEVIQASDANDSPGR